jgi:acyl carrier protein
MDRALLLEKTLGHIGEYLERDVSHLTPETRLDAAAPGMDSLKIFELMLYLEECFEVSFDESSMADVGTIGELVDYIAAAPPAKAAPATS